MNDIKKGDLICFKQLPGTDQPGVMKYPRLGLFRRIFVRLGLRFLDNRPPIIGVASRDCNEGDVAPILRH